MLTCLQCGDEAEVTETYSGIPIRACKSGHRTGKVQEVVTKPDGFEFNAADWVKAELEIMERISKAV